MAALCCSICVSPWVATACCTFWPCSLSLQPGISVGIQKFLRHCGSTSWAASSSSPGRSFGAVRGTDFWRCLRWFGKCGGIWWYLLASACFSLSEGLGYRLHAPGFLQGPSRAAVPFLRCPGCWSGGAEEVNGGCGEVALWKAGVRACRRWAPP